MEKGKNTGKDSDKKGLAKTGTDSEKGTEGAGNAPENQTANEPAKNIGNDDDGSPKIHENLTLNVVGKKIIEIFAEREKTTLPKITGTEVTKMCRDQKESLQVNFQYSDAKKLKGRVVLIDDKDDLSLPLDINQEFDFGVDYDAMAEEARARGEEWGEEQLAKAKEEADMDEKEKLRLSTKKLNTVGAHIAQMFEERSKTNLPGLIEKDVMEVLVNHHNSIGIKFNFVNEDCTQGFIELEEFGNKVRVPAEGEFTFGIDYDGLAKKKTEEAAAAAEKEKK